MNASRLKNATFLVDYLQYLLKSNNLLGVVVDDLLHGNTS
jgi:hypothetical protein